jgi:hypothetical protein
MHFKNKCIELVIPLEWIWSGEGDRAENAPSVGESQVTHTIFLIK